MHRQKKSNDCLLEVFWINKINLLIKNKLDLGKTLLLYCIITKYILGVGFWNWRFWENLERAHRFCTGKNLDNIEYSPLNLIYYRGRTWYVILMFPLTNLLIGVHDFTVKRRLDNQPFNCSSSVWKSHLWMVMSYPVLGEGFPPYSFFLCWSPVLTLLDKVR